MKKTIFTFILTIVFTIINVLIPFSYANEEAITIYAPDGTQSKIYPSEMQTYIRLGWHESLEDVVKTIYAPNGNEIKVYLAELDAYKAVGWYENKEDVTKTLYSEDGKEICVYLSEIPTYTALGWFENKSDVVKTLYSADGREMTVYKNEVPSHLNLGWYENKEDVTTVLASASGKKITVYNSEVQKYLELGWFTIQNNKIDPSKPMIALTYDDGPRPASTGRILTAFENYNARATFFVLGNLAKDNTQILQRMKTLGCQIGNHTYSHPDLTGLSSGSISTQLNNTANVVYNATGLYPTVIRPPYGSVNSNVLSTAQQPLILWSIDTLDWQHRNADRVVNHVLSNVKDGDIVLMHDIYDSTASATERLVPALVSRGYQLVTIDELSKYKSKPLNAHNKYTQIR